MPRISDNIPIKNETLDKRVKLTKEEKEDIKENRLGLSQRGLARAYGVSRRTIQFILDPEKLKKNIERRKERGGSKQYYDREKNNKYMRDHRNYKKELFTKGKIGTDEKNN